MNKYISMAVLRFKFDWMRLNEYKIHFFLRIISFICFSTLGILFWYIIINKITILKGWTLYSLAMIAIFGRFSGAFFLGFFGGIHDVGDEIKEGNITMYLTKPVNILFMIVSKRFAVLQIADLILGIVFILLTIQYFHQSVEFTRIIQSITISILGALLFAVFIGIFACFAFWITETEKILEILISFKRLDEQPLTIFPSIIQEIMTFAVPLIFIKVHPALILTGAPATNFWQILALEMIILTAFSIIFYFVWKIGLKRYEAVGG